MIDINDTLPTKPYFEISESNSICYVLDENVDGKYNYENVFNTHAINRSVEIPHNGVQFFNSYNIPFTQFRTNYETIEIKELVDDAKELAVPYVMIEQNISLKNAMDCKIVELTGGKTGIYFESGNQYDYDTDEITSQYLFNGFLPEFCKVGNYIDLGELGVHQIERLSTDDTNDVAVIDGFTQLYSSSFQIRFGSNPIDGDIINLQYKTETAINVTARTTPSVSGEYEIGATLTDTILNLLTYLRDNYPEYNIDFSYDALGDGVIVKRFTTDGTTASIWQTLVETGDYTISKVYAEESEDSRVKSIYNKENYNVYAFETEMLNKQNTRVGVKVSDTRDMFKDVTYTSERLEVDDDLEGFLEITWWNYEDSGDMDYSTKFFSVSHLPMDSFENIEIAKNEIDATDDAVADKGASIYQGRKYYLSNINELETRKLGKALSSSHIYIDRQRIRVYKSLESKRLGQTNTYDCEFTVLETERYNPLKYEGILNDRAVVFDGLFNNKLDIEL